MAKPRRLHPDTAKAVERGSIEGHPTLVPYPPAPRGNQRAKKHGARARVPDEVMQAKVRDIYAALSDSAPVRDDDGGLPAADAYTVLMLAQALGRWESVVAYIDKNSAFDRRGNPRPAVKYEQSLRREVMEYLAALGMTPKARARLGVDLAHQRDLAQEWSSRERRKAIDAKAKES